MKCIPVLQYSEFEIDVSLVPNDYGHPIIKYTLSAKTGLGEHVRTDLGTYNTKEKALKAYNEWRTMTMKLEEGTLS